MKYPRHRGHRRRRCPICRRRRYVSTNGYPRSKRWTDRDGVAICYICAQEIHEANEAATPQDPAPVQASGEAPEVG